MNWLTSYVVLRLSREGHFCEVYETNDMRKAKYWLGYIGEEGDVLCRSPKHPKFVGGDTIPQYWCHKEGLGAGGIIIDERRWRERCLRGRSEIPLPNRKLFKELVDE